MEKIENIIATNLIYLRKKANLTQLEFGEKFKYSDKTVSKWEMGVVIPSVPILKDIADFYGVTIDYILTQHKTAKDYDVGIKKTHDRNRKILIMALAVTIILTLAIIVYFAGAIYNDMGFNFKNNKFWVALPISVPLSFAVLVYYSNKFFRSSKLPYIFMSCFAWTAIFASILCLFSINYWFIFLIGIPIQFIIILIMKVRN